MRVNLPLQKLHGQFYDGASSMSGCKSGIAKRISEIEKRAVFTHCYGHTLKRSKVMMDALDTTREITELIKCSPRREAVFQGLCS